METPAVVLGVARWEVARAAAAREAAAPKVAPLGAATTWKRVAAAAEVGVIAHVAAEQAAAQVAVGHAAAAQMREGGLVGGSSRTVRPHPARAIVLVIAALAVTLSQRPWTSTRVAAAPPCASNAALASHPQPQLGMRPNPLRPQGWQAQAIYGLWDGDVSVVHTHLPSVARMGRAKSWAKALDRVPESEGASLVSFPPHWGVIKRVVWSTRAFWPRKLAKSRRASILSRRPSAPSATLAPASLVPPLSSPPPPRVSGVVWRVAFCPRARSLSLCSSRASRLAIVRPLGWARTRRTLFWHSVARKAGI